MHRPIARGGARRALVGAATLLALAAPGAHAAAGQYRNQLFPGTLTAADCGSMRNPVGPYDYRRHRFGSAILQNVEANHFNTDVENLVRGESSYIGGDLNYVLRAFPNHHKALYAVSRLSEQLKSETIVGLGWPVSCSFVRALEIAPDDATVHGMYAVHLSRLGKTQQALVEIEAAIKYGASDPNTLYNAGLIHFDAKDYDKALDYAQRAYAAGFPLPGLRNKLKSVGKWHDKPE